MSVYHNLYKDNIDLYHKEVLHEVVSNKATLFQSFYSVANGAFKWKNLPKNTLIHQPEEYLIYWGRVAFFLDDDGEPRILPAYPCGALREDGQYTEYYMVAKNGKQYRRKFEDVEICYDNCLQMPPIVVIKEFVEKSGYALSAVDMSLVRAMYGKLITCKNQSQIDAITKILADKNRSLEAFHMALAEGFKQDDINSLNLFDNRETDIVSLWETYVRYKNSFLTFYGVYNVEQVKGERLTEAESKGNEDIVRYTYIDDKYEQRMDFNERVKKHFDYDLGIEPNRSISFTREEIKEEQLLRINPFAPQASDGGEDNALRSETV